MMMNLDIGQETTLRYCFFFNANKGQLEMFIFYDLNIVQIKVSLIRYLSQGISTYL
jgi:hypothetical protein